MNALIANSLKSNIKPENNNSNNINPYYITGICEGDNSFYFSLNYNKIENR
jgi:hypothetical protein